MLGISLSRERKIIDVTTASIDIAHHGWMLTLEIDQTPGHEAAFVTRYSQSQER